MAKKERVSMSEIMHLAKIEQKVNDEWYNIRSLLGNSWSMFYIMIGAREAGKSYSAMDFCLNQWKKDGTPFIWIRLSSVSTKKMLANKAAKFVDADLYRKYDLDLTTKGMDVFDHGKKMAKILCLSDMAKEKGVALFDADYYGWYNIVCDEFMREPGEVKRFDITYNLTGTLENLVRSRKYRVRILMICNMLEDANDILVGLNFIPEKFGRYNLVKNKGKLMQMIKEFEDIADSDLPKAKKGALIRKVNEKYKDVDFGKRAIIDYIPPTETYLNRRQGTVADILAPDASNFTNKIDTDRALIYKGKLKSPTYVIKFSKNKSDWFVVWDGKIIREYYNEHKNVMAMRPYLDEVYSPEMPAQVIARYDARAYLFVNLITQKKFQKCLELLKSRG